MRMHPSPKRLALGLTAGLALFSMSACAARVEPRPEAALAPPPQTQAQVQPRPQQAPPPSPLRDTAPAPAAEDDARQAARRQPLAPRKTARAEPAPAPPRLGDPAQRAEAETDAPPVPPRGEGSQMIERPATRGPRASAQSNGQEEVAETPTLEEPSEIKLREPKGLSERYSSTNAQDIATGDYTSTLAGSNPTPDAAPEIDTRAGATPDGSYQVAEANAPRAPGFYGLLFGEDDAAETSASDAGETSVEVAQVDEQTGERMIESRIPPTFEEAPEPYTELPEDQLFDPYANPYAVTPESAEATPDPYGASPSQGGYAVAPQAPSGQQLPDAATAPVTGPVTIALLTPSSDSRPSIRTIAENLSKAAALAAEEIGNLNLVLRAYDTGGTPAGAAQAAQKAVGDGARLILGPLFSGSAAAVGPIARQAGVGVIAFTTDTSILGRGLYSLGYLPETEVDRILSFSAKRGITNIAVMAPDSAYGATVYQALQASAPRHGVRIARVQPVSSDFGAMDATSQEFADYYTSSNPDLEGILFATSGKPLQALAAYLAYKDVLPSKVKYMGLGIWDDPETFREATLRDGWFPGLDPALRSDFEERYRAKHGGDPMSIAALGYDGVAVAAALLEAAGQGGYAFGPSAIERPAGFQGMSGLFRFRPDGRNDRALAILKVGRRQFDLLDPAPRSFDNQVSRLDGAFGQ